MPRGSTPKKGTGYSKIMNDPEVARHLKVAMRKTVSSAERAGAGPSMKRTVLSLVLAIAALAIAETAGARPAPSGSFTLSPAPYIEGSSVSFTFGPLSHGNRNDEVTLGVWCVLLDGSQIPWGNRSNPYIYEFNSFGGFDQATVSLPLPVYGTGYDCTARYVEVDWFKGNPIRAWTLDEESFRVDGA